MEYTTKPHRKNPTATFLRVRTTVGSSLYTHTKCTIY